MSRLYAAADGYTIFKFLLAFRLLNAVTVRTFFQPDEYYQALEPAWSFTSVHGGAWITWEWVQHLRSALHPALFSAVYYVAEAIALWVPDSGMRGDILLYAPKILQTLFAALGDFYTWKLSNKVYEDSRLSDLTLCLTALSPWQWFCSTRTFSNGLENTLTIAALYYWPLVWKTHGARRENVDPKTHDEAKERAPQHGSNSIHVALVLAATASVLRPTNIIVWIALTICALFAKVIPSDTDSQGASKVEQLGDDGFLTRLYMLLHAGLFCGGLVFVISIAVDRAFYQAWTIPSLNFLYFNVVQSLAVFYGNNNWHYYITEGYPLLLTTALPFAIIGQYNIFRNNTTYLQHNLRTRTSLKQLAIICITLPAALSILSHKEVRFIYPILGPLNVIAAAPALQFFGPILFQSPAQQEPKSPSRFVRTLILVLIISVNIIIASYTSLTHNSGLIALPEYIRKEFQNHYQPSTSPQQLQNLTLAVLMPCHSLPWRSHFLNPPSQTTPGIQAWALTCEPPLHLADAAEKSSYQDEADVFYKNPTLWLRKNMSRRPPRDFLTPKLKGSDPNRSPGIYAADQPSDARNKFLRNTDSIEGSAILTHHAGLDITDLLTYLRTAPGQPPATESGVHIRRPWPHYLAFFEQLEPAMIQTLRGSGYVECWRRFNSHWHDDWRRKGDVIVWCLFPERARVQRSPIVRDGIGDERREWEKRRGDADLGVPVEQERVVADRPGVQTVVRN